MKREIQFENTFNGRLILDDGEVRISRDKAEASPYDLLFGALAGCLYATFLEILQKKRIDFKSCNIQVEGEKKDEIPAVLDYVHLKVLVKGSDKEEAIKKSFVLACKYCSIYETISRVAKMSYEIEVEA